MASAPSALSLKCYKINNIIWNQHISIIILVIGIEIVINYPAIICIIFQKSEL